jgi:hypothetical protein
MHQQTAMPMPRAAKAHRLRTIFVLTFLAVFLLPIVVRASAYAFAHGPTSWRDTNWSSIGLLPPASAYPQARVLVMSARAGGLKGVVAVHSWIVIKRTGAHAWARYDVVGWGNPLRTNNWPPDGRWFGTAPTIVADVSGPAADALIPKIEAAVKDYQYDRAGDYRIWPGPNSNTFVATVLRAVPELGAELPPNAVGRDFRPLPYAGLSDSRTGIEANLWGLLGIKIGRVEGIEVNVLGLVAGLDWRHPAVKLPGFGRIGFDAATPTGAATL